MLAMLLYSRNEWIDRQEDHRYYIDKGAAVAHFKTTYSRLEAYLARLEEWGIAKKVRAYKHNYLIILTPPVEPGEDTDTL